MYMNFKLRIVSLCQVVVQSAEERYDGESLSLPGEAQTL